jgi:hypothetical protein
VRTFLLVLQHSASPDIDTDLLRGSSTFDVEGIPEPAASSFLLQFFVGDLTGMSHEGFGSRFFDADLCVFGKLMAGVGLQGDRSCQQYQSCDGGQ